MRDPARSRWSLRQRNDHATTGDVRRSGPPDEERWWRPADQAIAEQELLGRRVLGKGWRPLVMVNNVERIRPLGDDPDSVVIESARRARVVTGLDEGRAWRHRDAGSLVVLRSEVYADEPTTDTDTEVAALHRQAWRDHGERALDATWRERWRERDIEPGWIEARRVGSLEAQPVDAARTGTGEERGAKGPIGPALPAECDWMRIEDHTSTVRSGPATESAVTVYEHLTVWGPRRQVTVVIRHDVGLDLDDVVLRCASGVTRRVLPQG